MFTWHSAASAQTPRIGVIVLPCHARLATRAAIDLPQLHPYKPPIQLRAPWPGSRGCRGTKSYRCHGAVRPGTATSGQRWSVDGETDLSAEQVGAQTAAWFPQAHGDGRRRAGDRPAAGQGAQAPLRLSGSCEPGCRWQIPRRRRLQDMRVVSLKRREDFLRLRGGVRWSTGAFVIETKRRAERSGGNGGVEDGARFGFTVTKKLGGAVVRNRIRRRLKEALRSLEPDVALPGHDYVLIARARASDVSFEVLKQDLFRGLTHVNETLQRRPAPSGRRAKPTSERDGPDQKAREQT